MHTTNLRNLSGSVMLAVPPALLEALHLGAGAKVGLIVENGRLVVEPHARKRYRLAELLAQSDYAEPPTQEEREWVEAPPSGREPL